MAYTNSADFIHSLIAETTFNTTPTATATRYLLPLAVDAPLLNGDTTKIASKTKMPNREGNGWVAGMETVDGKLDFRFQRSPMVDVLLQSALSSTFATNVLKGGIVDSSFSVLSNFQPGAAAGSQMVKVYSGCMVQGFSISAKGNDEVTSSWDIIGAKMTPLTTDNALVVATTAYPEFKAADLGAITIGGQAIDVLELDFETKLNRTRRPVVSSNVGLPYGVSGARETTLKIKCYRSSFAIDGAITGLPQSVSFQVGGVGTGYQVTIPGAIGMRPDDEISDGSALAVIEFSSSYDATSGAGLIITKL